LHFLKENISMFYSAYIVVGHVNIEINNYIAQE